MDNNDKEKMKYEEPELMVILLEKSTIVLDTSGGSDPDPWGGDWV